MNPASLDIKDILVAAGVGVFNASSGWSIRLDKELDSPDTSITLYDYDGASNPKWLDDTAFVQARVRSTRGSFLPGYAKALEVRDALLGLPAQEVNGTHYAGIWLQSGPVRIGRDEHDRQSYTLNFRINREPAAGTHRSAF